MTVENDKREERIAGAMVFIQTTSKEILAGFITCQNDAIYGLRENNEAFIGTFKKLSAENYRLRDTLHTLLQAAKSMPENPHTPSQMALDDAIEAAEKVMEVTR